MRVSVAIDYLNYMNIASDLLVEDLVTDELTEVSELSKY